MQFTDAVAVARKPRRTADGYLVAEARCVRTGIQLYAPIGGASALMAITQSVHPAINGLER
jgi:hypothetical protein